MFILLLFSILYALPSPPSTSSNIILLIVAQPSPLFIKSNACQPNYYKMNEYCWHQDYQYELQIQNKFIEDYDEEMNTHDAHKILITAFGKKQQLVKTLNHLPLYIYHNDSREILILKNNNEKIKLRKNQLLSFETNLMGRIWFSILIEDFDHVEESFDLPLFHVWAPFMSAETSESFPITTDAYYKLSQLNAENYSEKQQPVIQLMKQLMLPAAFPVISQQSQLEKRQWQRECRHLFSPKFGVLKSFKGHKEAHTRHLLDATILPQNLHYELKTDNERHHYLRHSTHSFQSLMKRTFYEDYLEKIKQTGKDGKTFFLSVFKDLPKSVFNGTALLSGDNMTSYLYSVEKGVSDSTKKSLVLTKDLISLLPFGNMINDKMGIDDIVNQVQNSSSLLITPLTFGLEVVVLGYDQATRLLVQSMKDLGAVIKGLLSKVGLTLNAIFQHIKSVMSWDHIILNQKILAAHFSKMIHTKAMLGGSQQLNDDINNTLSRLGDLTDQATQMLTSGNITSLPSLVRKANNEIIRNFTQNQPTPSDIQNSFLMDQWVGIGNQSALTNHFQVSQEEQDTLLDISKKVLDGMGNIATDSLQQIHQAMKQLVNQLSQDHWDFKGISQTIYILMKFSSQLLVQKAIQAILVVYDFWVSLIDKVLKYAPEIPFLTPFYMKYIGKSSLPPSLYDLYALLAVMPLSTGYSVFNKGENLFTKQQAAVLIATQDPELYINNLIAFDLQSPNKNITLLQKQYRSAVSYLLGGGYTFGQLMSATMGTLGLDTFSLYLARVSFEMISVMTNFPWSWYTNTQTVVGINIRYLSWYAQFLPFFFTWPSQAYETTGLMWYMRTFITTMTTIPGVLLILRVWYQDLALIHPNASVYNATIQTINYLPGIPGVPASAKLDTATTFDVTLKSIARLMFQVPNFLNLFAFGSAELEILFYEMPMYGAALHFGRLMVDMATGAIFSV